MYAINRGARVVAGNIAGKHGVGDECLRQPSCCCGAARPFRMNSDSASQETAITPALQQHGGMIGLQIIGNAQP